ncbi:MAG: energy-coupling factor ABC transporter permease [Anaerolineae bacterium]|nr:energy-coupling factor ABC transporter permease [Anaerolineae bacterium]
MHIPDGFLSVAVAVICWVLAVVGVGVSLWRSGKTLGARQVPLMGVLAAFIFAAQMLNFTVAGGTSGHMIGGALAAILLGPWAAILTMTTVVGIQALVFQDGGLLVMGANILNMGIISVLVAYGVYRGVMVLAGGRRWGLFVGGFAAAWLSVVVAAVATSVQLAFSGTSPLGVALPAMAGVHVLIGIGEGLITVGALAFVAAARRDLVPALGGVEGRPSGRPVRGLGWTAVGLVIALAVTLFAPLASEHPDGLERVAEDLGFIDLALDAPYEIIPDYALPGISEESPMATILAGIVGVLIVAIVGFGIAFAVVRLRQRTAPQEVK